MTKNNLKVVKSTKDKELENKEKDKALEAYDNLDQIAMFIKDHEKLHIKFEMHRFFLCLSENLFENHRSSQSL